MTVCTVLRATGRFSERAFQTSATDAVRGTDREQTVHLSIGDVPAEEYLMQLFADFLIHSWDLDQGLGGGDPLDSDLVAACASWFADREELYRSAGAIGPRLELPDDADDQARLLAAFGPRS